MQLLYSLFLFHFFSFSFFLFPFSTFSPVFRLYPLNFLLTLSSLFSLLFSHTRCRWWVTFFLLEGEFGWFTPQSRIGQYVGWVMVGSEGWNGYLAIVGIGITGMPYTTIAKPDHLRLSSLLTSVSVFCFLFGVEGYVLASQWDLSKVVHSGGTTADWFDIYGDRDDGWREKRGLLGFRPGNGVLSCVPAICGYGTGYSAFWGIIGVDWGLFMGDYWDGWMDACLGRR